MSSPTQEKSQEKTQRKRIQHDIQNMNKHNYELTFVDDKITEFYVPFKGPAETPFEGGVWKVHIDIPKEYPFRSPSVGFVNRIFHPNIDELSGSVCLDVINQSWTPIYEVFHIFDVFLPQLLRYPNPTDPLNGEAAALLIREPKSYDAKVKEYVQKYARGDESGGENEDDDEDDDNDDDDDDDFDFISDDDDTPDDDDDNLSENGDHPNGKNSESHPQIFSLES